MSAPAWLFVTRAHGDAVHAIDADDLPDVDSVLTRSRQPQPEVHVLPAELEQPVREVAADELPGRAAHERARSPARSCRGGRAPDPTATVPRRSWHSSPTRASIPYAKAASGAPLQRAIERQGAVRQQLVVGVEQEHERSARFRESAIARTREAGVVRVLDELQRSFVVRAREASRAGRNGLIGGAVVDDDDLERHAHGGEGALDCAPEELGLVVARDHDAQQRARSPAAQPDVVVTRSAAPECAPRTARARRFRRRECRLGIRLGRPATGLRGSSRAAAQRTAARAPRPSPPRDRLRERRDVDRIWPRACASADSRIRSRRSSSASSRRSASAKPGLVATATSSPGSSGP